MKRIELTETGLENVLSHLGNVYINPLDAFREFITNGIDAGASNIIVSLQRKKPMGLSIQDDGKGMSFEEVLELPNRIADSIKAMDDSVIGEKGIGMLAYQAMGEELKLQTSDGNESSIYKMFKGSLDVDITQLQEELAIQGTKVEILEIDPTLQRLITVNKIAEYLSREFREKISGGLKIVVNDGNEHKIVTPEIFKGQILLNENYNTPFGKVNIELYIRPEAKTQRVGVSHKGQRVCDIISIPEFNNYPWNLGVLDGSITANFVKLNTGRDGLMREGKHFPVWLKTVVDQQNYIEEQTRYYLDKIKKKESQRCQTIIASALSTFFKENKDLALGTSYYTSKTGGEEIEGKDGLGSGRKIRSQKKVNKPSTSPLGPKTLIPEEGMEKQNARIRKGVNYTEMPLDDPISSTYNEDTNEIIINTAYPLFIQETMDETRGLVYRLRVISNEIVENNYKNMKDTRFALDKSIEIHYALIKHAKI